MHIIKFDQRSVLKLQRGEALEQDEGGSEAKAQPSLYGHRRHILQSALALMVSAFLPAAALRPAAALGAAAPLKIIAFGDSLTAGYKLAAAEAFPAVLERALRKDGLDVTVVNAGVSGETASDGLARFDWTFTEGADGAILELGANDMLRGLDIKQTRMALGGILDKLRARKIPVLIAGMLASPSLGADYQEAFNRIFQDLAHSYDAPLYPFFLEGVMNNRKLQLADGLHPNREGVEQIVQNMLPIVEQFIKGLPGRN